jgi:hypothetical protein
MNLFFNRKATTMDQSEVTGTDAIRRRVWARWRKAHLATTARDMSIPLPALEAFAQGTGQLSAAQLQALAKEFFPHHVAFDPVADRLVDTSPAPTRLGTPPEPWRPGPDYVPWDPTRPVIGPQFEKPMPQTSGKPKPRPGFAAA